MPEQLDETPSESKAARLPFDVEFYTQADAFCTTAMHIIPELSGVVIMPLWHTPVPESPPGLVRTRDPQNPQNLQASKLQLLLRTLQQLTLLSVDIHKGLMGQIQVFNLYASRLAQDIKSKQEQLADMPPEAPTPDA
jgi:hypothetical protein